MNILKRLCLKFYTRYLLAITPLPLITIHILIGGLSIQQKIKLAKTTTALQNARSRLHYLPRIKKKFETETKQINGRINALQ